MAMAPRPGTRPAFENMFRDPRGREEDAERGVTEAGEGSEETESESSWDGTGPLGNPYDLLDPKKFFGRRFWVAAFVCTTYILAFGKTDGKPMIEALGEKASGLTGVARSRRPQPEKVGVRANIKSKAVRGHGTRARTVKDGAGQRAGTRGAARNDRRSALGVSERRDASQQTGREVKLNRNEKGQFVKPQN